MFVIDTEKLEIGRPLRFDLTSLDGHLLATSGTRVTQEHKSDWIRRGFDKVCSYIASEYNEQPAHLRPYNPILVQRLEANLDMASQSVEKLSEQIREEQTNCKFPCPSLTEELLENIDQDVAAALAVAFGFDPSKITLHDRAIARRSSQLSMLGTAVATELGFSRGDIQLVGLAGLLSDLSLMSVTHAVVAKFSANLPFDHPYLNHPLASACLLEKIVSVDPKIQMAVAQIHEQPDGGGFPKGLPAHRIMLPSRLLSILDAYITLTAVWQPEPLPAGRNLQPCDALAYLMHNATLGRFDSELIKGFARAISLYPIGSRIRLSDGTEAVVLRSNKNEPGKPVVRIEDSSLTIRDLRETSLKILSPLDKNRPMNRLSKADLDDILYR